MEGDVTAESIVFIPYSVLLQSLSSREQLTGCRCRPRGYFVGYGAWALGVRVSSVVGITPYSEVTNYASDLGFHLASDC